MASENVNTIKSAPSELDMETIDVIDGIVINKTNDGSKNIITKVKPEPREEEENVDENLHDQSNVDPFRLVEEEVDEMEEVEESNVHPSRLKKKRKNFVSDNSDWILDDDVDVDDEFQLDDLSDMDEYTIEDSNKRKRMSRGKEQQQQQQKSHVAAKKPKTNFNDTKHTNANNTKHTRG